RLRRELDEPDPAALGGDQGGLAAHHGKYRDGRPRNHALSPDPYRSAADADVARRRQAAEPAAAAARAVSVGTNAALDPAGPAAARGPDQGSSWSPESPLC